MNKAYFNELFDYNYWAHRQVWACVKELSEEQFMQDLDYSIGSIYIQCFHTMAVESWWFKFLKEGRVEFLDEEDYPDRPSIRAKWDQVEAYVRGYIDSLTTAELEREVLPPFWENKPSIKVWEGILQVATHSTDHRAQMLAGLHRVGGLTVGQDVLDYIFDTRKV